MPNTSFQTPTDYKVRVHVDGTGDWLPFLLIVAAGWLVLAKIDPLHKR